MDPLSFLAGMISLPTLALLIVSILITIEIAYDLGFLATLTAGVFAAVTWYLGWFTLAWFSVHWMEALIGLGGYVLVGIGWAIVKWWFYVRARLRYVTDTLVNSPSYVFSHDVPPQVSNHKQDIIRWMSWWPFSLIGTLLNDPFRRMFEAIYRNLAVYLQSISDRAFSGIKLNQR